MIDDFRAKNPGIPFIIDTDTDSTSGALSGPFDEAVLEGLRFDAEEGAKGWAGLKAQVEDEDAEIAIPFTSGTTAKPKGVVYTHRGAYLAALGNVIESGLNYHQGRCGYLWTLPMFHAMGWSEFFLLFLKTFAREKETSIFLEWVTTFLSNRAFPRKLQIMISSQARIGNFSSKISIFRILEPN